MKSLCPGLLRTVGLVGAAGALGLGAALIACATTATTTTIAPITGIVVRADSLIAGRGCGNDPGQIYEYTAIVHEKNIVAGTVVSLAGSFPCYADATFVNLPSSGDLSHPVDYKVTIFAFNRDDWDKQNANGAVDIAAASLAPADVTVARPNPVDAFAAITPTWQTACDAAQQSSVEVLAVCQPLVVPSLFDAGPDGE